MRLAHHWEFQLASVLFRVQVFGLFGAFGGGPAHIENIKVKARNDASTNFLKFIGVLFK